MSKRTLVVGASLKSNRYSYTAIKRLIANGHEVKALGIKEGDVDGVKIETGMPNFKGIDTVTLYLNPKRHEMYYQYIISLKPKRVIFNPGTENEEFSSLLRENNIKAENACSLVLLATNQY